MPRRSQGASPWRSRVKQQLWYDYGASAAADKYTHGHDRNSSRLWRENNVTGDKKNELYHYDSDSRLTAFERGNLNYAKTSTAGR